MQTHSSYGDSHRVYMCMHFHVSSVWSTQKKHQPRNNEHTRPRSGLQTSSSRKEADLLKKLLAQG